MALPVCQLCGEKEAAQLLTNFQTGESLAICEDDYPSFILGLAEKMMENGLIELPEVDYGTAAGDVDDAQRAQLDHEIAEFGPQIDLRDPTAPAATRQSAKRQRAPRATTAAPGPSPESLVEAHMATVAPQDDETADSPVDVATN